MHRGGGLEEPGVSGGELPSGGRMLVAGDCGELVEQVVQRGQMGVEGVEVNAVRG